jgi:hypothetical protein
VKRSFCLATAFAALLALSVSAARARLASNCPALDGREVALPGGLRLDRTPLERVPELPTEEQWRPRAIARRPRPAACVEPAGRAL